MEEARMGDVMTGITLAELLRRPARNSQEISLSILRQAAAILDEGHRNGHLHPALSPESILVFPAADNRLVRVEIPDLYSGARAPLQSQNVPEYAKYMSREEILGMTRDSRSDVFSLGAIAYEMLTGRKPFDAPDLSQLCYAICVEQPPAADAITPGIPHEAARALARALAKEPEARWSTCAAFVAAIDSALAVSQEHSSPAALAPFDVPTPEPFVTPEADLKPASATSAFTAAAMASTIAGAQTAASPWRHRYPQPEAAPQPAVDPGVSPPHTFASLPSELPPLPDRSRNRRRQDTLDPDGPARPSLLQRFGLWGLAILLLAGVLAWLLNWHPKPDVPVQVLETKNAPATPPPTVQPPSPTPNASQVPPPPRTSASPAPVRNSASVPHSGTSQVPTANSSSVPVRPSASREAAAPPQPPASGSAFVEMVTEPPGAQLIVDNRASAACTAPCSLELPAGRHVLTAQLNGFAPASRIFHVPEDRSLIIPLGRSVGTLLVTSNPEGATILLDGKEVGRAPVTLHVSAGQHRVDAMYGAAAQQKTVDVQADSIQGATFDLH